MNDPRHILSLALAVAALLACFPARAALGEPATSIRSDRAALRAVDRATRVHRDYSVHELQVGGTLVREFVAPSGIVFAVAWNGLSQPDLTPLLGQYAPAYAQARRARHPSGGRRQQRVDAGSVVVETWGHMRSLQGRAYVPALLPPGVSIDDIS